MADIQTFFKATLAPKLDYLAMRWRDEREYENFDDYVKIVRELVNGAGFRFQRLTRAFNLKFNDDRYSHEVHVTARGIRLTSHELVR